MSAPVAIAPHTAAMLSRLRATGLPVGDGRKPAEGGWQGAEGQSQFVTYLVLHEVIMRRAGRNASIADRMTDPELTYQVNAVGIDRQAAGTAADLACARLTNGVALDIPGRATVVLRHDVSLGISPDESVSPPLFMGADRYVLETH